MSASKRRRSDITEGDTELRSEGNSEPQIVVPVFSRKGCCPECGTMTKITERGHLSQCRKCWGRVHSKYAGIMKDLNLYESCYMVSTVHLFELNNVFRDKGLDISPEVNTSLNEENINHAFKRAFESTFTNPNDKNVVDAYVLLAQNHLNFTKGVSDNHKKEELDLLSMASACMTDCIWNSIEPCRVLTGNVEDKARSAFAKICHLREIFGKMDTMGGRVLGEIVEVMGAVFHQVVDTDMRWAITHGNFVQAQFRKTAELCGMTKPQCHVSEDVKDKLIKVIKLAELHLELGCYSDN